ncbi:MAG: DUF368 domain-containing protein [Cellulomonadaceae bacterium]|nr:DUF368 domain-containing protein [Cellulomonadaceae bacterium]
MGSWIARVIKGIVIALGFILPGVSGGVLAAVLGLYERLLHFLANFRARFKEDALFFVPVAIGGLIGLVLLSRPLEYAIEHWRVPVMWGFAGAILGTIPSLWRAALSRKNANPALVHGDSGEYGSVNMCRDLKDWLWLIGTFAIALVGLYLLPITIGMVPVNFGTMILAGALIALGILVPGLSPSNLLIILGLLTPMLSGFSSIDILGTFLPIAIGAIAAIAAFSKLMERALERFHSRVYHFIIGMVLASTVLIVVPTPPASAFYNTDEAMTYAGLNASTYLVAGLLFLGGLALGLWMSRLEDKYKGDPDVAQVGGLG